MVKSAGQLTLDYYDTHGLLESVEIGSTTTSYSYSGFGEIENYAVADTAGSLFEVDYTYDDLGRIDTLTEDVDGATGSYQYIYDDRGRLEEVLERDAQSGAFDTIESYGYDGNGNRTSVDNAFDALSGSDIVVDAQDRLTQYGDLEFTYTDSGELLTKTDTQSGESTSFDYDVFSNLRGVDLPDGRAIEYEVDALDRRIARRVLDAQGSVVNEQRWVYKDQLNPIAEFDGDGNLTKRFVYASKPQVPDYMIAVDPQTGDETTYRIVSDHVGSVRLVVDVDTGTIAQRMRYDAWGNVLENTNEGFQPFGYAGGLYDAETELVRFGARDYDARVGRWTTKDPIGFGGEDGNLYGYTRNDPVNLLDPSGLLPGVRQVGGGCPSSTSRWERVKTWFDKGGLTAGVDVGADFAIVMGWSVGMNLQVYQPTPGDYRLGVFGRYSVMKGPLSVGVSGTGNAGWGWGEWSGDFQEVDGNAGSVAAGVYKSPDVNSVEGGYVGGGGGYSVGSPAGAAISKMRYVEWISFDL